MAVTKDDFEDILLYAGGFLMGYIAMVYLMYLFSSMVVLVGEYQKEMIREVYAEIAAEQKLRTKEI